jgi:hypothetical protein
METKIQFGKLLSTKISPVLEEYGFRSSGLTFVYREKANWGLINFQKSKQTIPEALGFTVNLGVASGELLKFFSPITSEKKPDIWDCHWRIRLGRLIWNEDIWWSIDTEKSIDKLGQEILALLIEYAIPEIHKYQTDMALRDLWLSGSSPSLTEFQRLQYLSVLLNELGPSNLLEQILEKLKQVSKGKPTEKTAEIHINKLLGKS